MNYSGWGQGISPGDRSPLKDPYRTMLESNGGNTGTIARTRSAGVINNSPLGVGIWSLNSITHSLKNSNLQDTIVVHHWYRFHTE